MTPAAPATDDQAPVEQGPQAGTNPAAPEEADASSGTPSAAGEGVVVLVVRGPARGRWRIGRQFGPEPTTLVQDELTLEEVGALRADPELTVSEA